MDKPPPICAHCREKITDLWQVTREGLVLCGSGACEHWAHVRGLRIVTRGRVGGWVRPTRPRHPRPTACPSCHGPLPRKVDRWPHAGKEFCTLTCMERATVSAPGA